MNDCTASELTTRPRNAKTLLVCDSITQALISRLNRVARSTATVLITGETGTGKELFARHVHEHSGRTGPFVAVNCGALSDTLADAELFGHERGAYTGAARSQVGWFEAAQRGTLFLDEIGDLPLGLQVKMLRVLQEREVIRVGSRVPVPVDVRVVAATNVDLAAAVEAKRFRADLLFRLKVAAVALPPLRGRVAAIGTLAQHLLQRYCNEQGRADLSFGAGALAVLGAHTWPGNVRELEHVIHNAVLQACGSRIEVEHLQLSVPAATAPAGRAALDEALRSEFEERIQHREPDLFNYVTRTLVQCAFDMADGNQLRTAEYLGISRHALRTQLSHLGIIPRRRRTSGGGMSEAPVLRFLSSAYAGSDLRIGYQKYGTLSLLKAERALERERIQVHWTEFEAGPQLLDALHSGEIDFGATGEVPPIIAQANGARLVYVGHEPPSPCGVALVVPQDSPARNVTDLRGKRIALNKGSNVHYLLVRCLEANGLSLDAVHPVYAAPHEIQQQLATGAVDAWVAWDPFLTVAQRSGKVRVLKDGDGLVSNHQFHLASSELAARHPQIVHCLLEKLREVGRSAVRNPAKTARGAAAELGIDATSLEIAIRRLTHGAKPLDIRVIHEQQKIADRFYALGLIPRAITVRQAVWVPTRA